MAVTLMISNQMGAEANEERVASEMFGKGQFLVSGDTARRCDCLGGYAIAIRSYGAHARFRLSVGERREFSELTVLIAVREGVELVMKSAIESFATETKEGLSQRLDQIQSNNERSIGDSIQALAELLREINATHGDELELSTEGQDVLVEAAISIGRYARLMLVLDEVEPSFLGFMLGGSLGRMGELNLDMILESRDWLGIVLRSNPEHALAVAALGIWHARLAASLTSNYHSAFGIDPEMGKQLLTNAEELVGDNISALFELALAWRDLKMDERAELLLRRATRAKTVGEYDRRYRELVIRMCDEYALSCR